jgi:hypothetical protein
LFPSRVEASQDLFDMVLQEIINSCTESCHKCIVVVGIPPVLEKTTITHLSYFSQGRKHILEDEVKHTQIQIEDRRDEVKPKLNEG